MYTYRDYRFYSIEEHLILINKIVKSAKETNIKFNTNKLQYCQKKIKFLGHVVNKDGMRPDQEQVKAIGKLKIPNYRVELQGIIGMCNYLHEIC